MIIAGNPKEICRGKHLHGLAPESYSLALSNTSRPISGPMSCIVKGSFEPDPGRRIVWRAAQSRRGSGCRIPPATRPQPRGPRPSASRGLGMVRTATSSALRRVTTSAGVTAGAMIPIQFAVTSNPGTPDSAMVGMSGASGVRRALVTRARACARRAGMPGRW